MQTYPFQALFILFSPSPFFVKPNHSYVPHFFLRSVLRSLGEFLRGIPEAELVQFAAGWISSPPPPLVRYQCTPDVARHKTCTERLWGTVCLTDAHLHLLPVPKTLPAKTALPQQPGGFSWRSFSLLSVRVLKFPSVSFGSGLHVVLVPKFRNLNVKQ